MTSVPGITYIGMIQCSSLAAHLESKSLAGMNASVSSGITEVEFIGVPECSVSTEYDNNGYSSKVTLKFVSEMDIPLSFPLAFVIKDVSGQGFLIGKKEKCYPVIKKDRDTGTPASVKAAFSYQIEYVALVGLIKVSI